MTALWQELRVEWIRLRTRRDIQVVLLVIPVLTSLQYAASLSGELAQLQTAPGVVLPPEVYRLQEITLSRYQFPHSILTVLLNSAPVVMLGAGLLAALSIGSEFAGGTVRTSLVFNGNRPRYLVGRVLGALVLVLLAIMLVLLMGATLPTIAHATGTSLPVPPGLSRSGTMLFGSAYSLAIGAVMMFAVLITILTRSAVIASASLLGLAATSSALVQLSGRADVTLVLPTAAIEALVTQAAVVAGGVEIPGMSGAPSTAVMVNAAIVTLVFALGLLLASAYFFFFRDID